jgi:hypothetical protein
MPPPEQSSGSLPPAFRHSFSHVVATTSRCEISRGHGTSRFRCTIPRRSHHSLDFKGTPARASSYASASRNDIHATLRFPAAPPPLESSLPNSPITIYNAPSISRVMMPSSIRAHFDGFHAPGFRFSFDAAEMSGI